MKILFICGSLEPGRDGVGDYTRRLAGEIIRQGHDASIIALNDRFVDAIIRTEQLSEKTNISVLRLPSILPKKEKYKTAGKFIQDFNPEWLSLQFVPYSFQKRGLPFGLGKNLGEISSGRKWHIMFHELGGWAYKDIFMKLKWTSILQRFIINRLLKTIHPKVVHTNITWRVSRLEAFNIHAKLLPLFGNIPVQFEKSCSGSSNIIFIIFGSIHSGADTTRFAKWLSHLQQTENKKVIVHFVGKNGNELTVWEESLKNQDIEYQVYGEQDESIISKLMSQSDIGIVTTPYFLIEKSGSRAAMQEHRLPVICVAKEWKPAGITFTHDIPAWQPGLQLNNILEQKTEAHSLQKITKCFIHSLLNR
ncbi:hypothetical protein FACS189446_1060 [Bacteroidia bacterium]|nr:hypothetical protein FACS189446_1060 [Bacteroidia bacterium]